MPNILFLWIFILAVPLMAGVEEVEITTYYPAPYGDFENIRTDTMEIGGVLRGIVADGSSFVKGMTTIDQLRPISTYKEFRVLGEFLTADGGTATEDTLTNYMSVRPNGVFRRNARNGLFFDIATQRGVFRSQGDLFLQPGYTGNVNNYSFVKNTTPTRFVVAEGAMIVNGDFSVLDGSGNVILIVSKLNQIESTGRPVVVMSSDVVINGKLTVNGGITGDISGSNVKVKNLQVKNTLVVESGGHLLALGSLRASAIQSTSPSQFEIKVNGGGTIARFHRGGRGIALEIPGKADGWGRRRQSFV